MGDKLKIEEDRMKEITSSLQTAINAYKGFAQAPFTNEISDLDQMNTDFLAKFSTMISDINDSNVSVISDIEDVASMAGEIVKTFEKVDDDATNSMGFTQEG